MVGFWAIGLVIWAPIVFTFGLDENTLSVEIKAKLLTLFINCMYTAVYHNEFYINILILFNVSHLLVHSIDTYTFGFNSNYLYNIFRYVINHLSLYIYTYMYIIYIYI